MAGLGAKDILRNITALEQLIEEINFQRAKEMRQCLMSKDSDTSFVIVHGTTYWTDLFVRHFLFQTDRSTDADDLLFFIRKKQVRGSRYIPKYQTEVEVYRKDSRKLPIGDPDIDWEETVYLNLIIHQFDYTLTLAVCTRTSPKELQVLKRHSQKVYASPSRRRMDSKGEVEEITYPNVCFHVDNFDEVFADMLVRDGEMVCVELVAADHGGSRQAVIFLGSIRYDALKRVYDTRASLSSKVAQRMMLGLFSGGASQRIEFVRMKGPQGKGHAEMAVTKPKGSGVETPTSEPGVCLTDLWDSDWEDEPEDRFLYRHQRRLSDPSANFNTFINSGWVSKAEGKSRSENEGLDNFANGLYEIESGDVRDAVCSCRCCSVVACRRYEDEDGGIMIEGVCKKCDHFHGKRDPNKFVEGHSDASKTDHLHHACEEPPMDVSKDVLSKEFCSKKDFNLVMGVEAAEAFELSCSISNQELCSLKPDLKGGTEKSYEESVEVTSLEVEEERPDSPLETDPFLLGDADTDTSPERIISAARKHSDPTVEYYSKSRKESKRRSLRSARPPGSAVRVNSSELRRSSSSFKEYSALPTFENDVVIKQPNNSDMIVCNRLPLFPHLGSHLQSSKTGTKTTFGTTSHRSGPLYTKSFSLDPKKLESFKGTENQNGLTKSVSLDDVTNFKKALKKQISVPCRVTKDGTRVYFPCDIKLDDGAYNPLWTTKGFTQTFHFWKESRRAQSIPLNAYLTYVTLPWFTIITDILDHRTGPILTF